MIPISARPAAQQIAYQRAKGARDVAYLVEAQTDKLPETTARELLPYHAAGFTGFIDDAITGAEPQSLSHARAESSCVADTDAINKNAHIEKNVQIHTGALDYLDAAINNDQTRLRRAASLSRIIDKMKSGSAIAADYARFYEPGGALRKERTPYDAGYALIARYPNCMPPLENAVVARSWDDEPAQWVTHALEVIAALPVHERIVQIRAFRDTDEHPQVLTRADERSIESALGGAFEEAGDEAGPRSERSSMDTSPASSRDASPERNERRYQSAATTRAGTPVVHVPPLDLSRLPQHFEPQPGSIDAEHDESSLTGHENRRHPPRYGLSDYINFDALTRIDFVAPMRGQMEAQIQDTAARMHTQLQETSALIHAQNQATNARVHRIHASQHIGYGPSSGLAESHPTESPASEAAE